MFTPPTSEDKKNIHIKSMVSLDVTGRQNVACSRYVGLSRGNVDCASPGDGGAMFPHERLPMPNRSFHSCHRWHVKYVFPILSTAPYNSACLVMPLLTPRVSLSPSSRNSSLQDPLCQQFQSWRSSLLAIPLFKILSCQNLEFF